MHTILRGAAEEGKIQWVFRDFPLTSIHPRSFRMAESARCAGEQGKFWEYADALYDAQENIRNAQDLDQQLESLMQGIQADPAAFKACRDSGKSRDAITAEMLEAESLQIDGTPTMYINGQRHEGLIS